MTKDADVKLTERQSNRENGRTIFHVLACVKALQDSLQGRAGNAVGAFRPN